MVGCLPVATGSSSGERSCELVYAMPKMAGRPPAAALNNHIHPPTLTHTTPHHPHARVHL
jgi:hypothetical protein